MALALRLVALCAAFAAAAAVCPSEEWIAFEGTCYWRSPFHLEWRSVESVCAWAWPGSTPVSVHSFTVNSFLTEHVLNFDNGWLGLRRADTGHPWYWADGSPFDWSDWKEGQPADEGELCGLISRGSTGEWRAVDCVEGYTRFVCQIADQPEPTTTTAQTTTEPPTTEPPTTQPPTTEPPTTEPPTTEFPTTTQPPKTTTVPM